MSRRIHLDSNMMAPSSFCSYPLTCRQLALFANIFVQIFRHGDQMAIVVVVIVVVTFILIGVISIVVLFLPVLTNVVIVIPIVIALIEGSTDRRRAGLALVKGHLKAHGRVHDIDIVHIVIIVVLRVLVIRSNKVSFARMLLIRQSVLIGFTALVIGVIMQLQFGGGKCFAFHTSNTRVEHIDEIAIVVRDFDLRTTQEGCIVGDGKVLSLFECLVIEIGAHVMGNADHKGGNFGKVALIAVGGFVELEFDHVALVAERIR